MRVPAALFVFAIAVPLVAASASDQASNASSAPKCPRTTSHYAANDSLYRGGRMSPRKLTELPPATPYMAVYRRIGDCEVPLTMVDYRNPRRR